MKMKSFQYADGSGNLYKLSHQSEWQIEYQPVQTEQSSSGIYSGGKPFTKTLNAQESQELLKLIEKASQATSQHIDKRVMMSGWLKINDSIIIILAPKSQSKKELEQWLKSLANESN